MRTIGLFGSLVLLACGPAVETIEASGSESGGQSTGAEETSSAPSTSGGESGITGPGSESSGGSPIICGDGVMEGDEACDDGNKENADGCNVTCETSGSIRWTELLPAGFAIGLSARDGNVVAALQQYNTDLGPDVVISGFEASGDAIGEYLDAGGFSDSDFARDPAALLPDGRVALGYAVVDTTNVSGSVQERHFGILDFERGIVGAYLEEEFEGFQFYGTTYHSTGTLVLRGDDSGGETMLVVQQFDDNAALIASFPMGVSASDNRPFGHGALPERVFPMALVFTASPEGQLDVHTNLFGQDWYSGTFAESAGTGRLSSFSDARGLSVWTGSDLVWFDEQDHPQASQPLSFEGTLLWADQDGLVVGHEGSIVLYDAEGAERVVVPVESPDEFPVRLQYVRPDPVGGGLFVLADTGETYDAPTVDPALLLYIVR